MSNIVPEQKNYTFDDGSYSKTFTIDAKNDPDKRYTFVCKILRSDHYNWKVYWPSNTKGGWCSQKDDAWNDYVGQIEVKLVDSQDQCIKQHWHYKECSWKSKSTDNDVAAKTFRQWGKTGGKTGGADTALIVRLMTDSGGGGGQCSKTGWDVPGDLPGTGSTQGVQPYWLDETGRVWWTKSDDNKKSNYQITWCLDNDAGVSTAGMSKRAAKRF